MIKSWGRNLQDAVRPLNAAEELGDPPPRPRVGEYTPPVMQYAEAPEAPYVRAAEAIVEEVRTSLERGEGYPDQVPTALAMLAVSASLDALRETLADRLDTIGNTLSELKD